MAESRRTFLGRAARMAIGGVADIATSRLIPSGSDVNNYSNLSDWRLLASPGASVSRRHDPDLNRQIVQVVTSPTGAEARLCYVRGGPITLRNRFLKFWLKVEAGSASDLDYVAIKVGAGGYAFQNYEYQEILGTGGPQSAPLAYLSSTIKPGEWTPFTIGRASFEGVGSTNVRGVDYDHIQDFEVAVASTPGTTTNLSFGGMSVVDGDPRYPSGVISLTFDDGLSSPFRLAFPILQAHHFPATAYVIHNEIGKFTSSYLSESQLTQLGLAGWEVAAHANSISDHNARLGFLSLGDDQLKADVEQEAAWLARLGFHGSTDLALPKGYFTTALLQKLQRFGHFQTIRASDFRSVETLPVANPFKLRCRLYDHTQPIGPPSLPGALQWRIDQVASYGGWLIIGIHDLQGEPSSGPPIVDPGTAMLQSDFAVLVDYIAKRGVPVRTIQQIWTDQAFTT